jgi:hypothetical protein
MKNASDNDEEAGIEATAHALGQLEGNRAKGEFLLIELQKKPWLAKYLRAAYDPCRSYDARIRARVPLGLLNKIFEKADLPPVPERQMTIFEEPGRVSISHHEETSMLCLDGEQVAQIRWRARVMQTMISKLLQQLGITIED